MAAFAKASFSASTYASFRPPYPQSLFSTILVYHRGPKSSLLDLGTGHGALARGFASDFLSVVGTDVSQPMLSHAISATPTSGYTNVEFRQAPAEKLSFVENGAIDAVVAGQAAHWFSYPKAWEELKRVVRRGGTIAFFGYKDPMFPNHPKASRIMQEYDDSMEEGKLGRYWQRPGRDICNELYRDIVPPEADWEDVQRFEYHPGSNGVRSGSGTRFLHRKMMLGDVMEYARTWSAAVNWAEQHPRRISRSKGGEGDVIDDMFDEMRAVEEDWTAEKEVDLEWGTVLLLARKR